MIEIKYFQSCHYPDVFMREQIAMKLELKESRISVGIIVIPIIIFICHYYSLLSLFIIIIMIITKLKEKNQESWSVPISLPFKLPQYFSVRTKRDCLFVGLVPKPAGQV